MQQGDVPKDYDSKSDPRDLDEVARPRYERTVVIQHDGESAHIAENDQEFTLHAKQGVWNIYFGDPARQESGYERFGSVVFSSPPDKEAMEFGTRDNNLGTDC